MIDVRPKKWSSVIDLYDDGQYSIIWGNYEKNVKRCLGVRWNGNDNEAGFPNQGGNSTWYVEPDFLTQNILSELHSRVIKDKTIGKISNILLAIKECKNK